MTFGLLVVREGYAPIEPNKGVDPLKNPILLTLKPHDLDGRDPALVLQGRVVNENNDPVSGATVRPIGLINSATSYTIGRIRSVDPLAVTNERGEFRLGVTEKELPVILHIEAPLLAFEQTEGLAPGAKTHLITLVRGATVQGTVLRDGKPASNVTLVLAEKRDKRPGSPFQFEIAPDPQGRFRFDNVSPDREYLFYGTLQSCRDHGVLPTKTLQIGRTGTETEVGDLTFQPGRRVSGTLALSDGKPLQPKTEVYLVIRRPDVMSEDYQTVYPKDGGTFDFMGVPDGEYSLRAHVPGYRMSPRNASFDLFNKDQLVGIVNRDIDGLRVLLEPGEPLPRLDFRNLPRDELSKLSKESLRRRKTLLTGSPPD